MVLVAVAVVAGVVIAEFVIVLLTSLVSGFVALSLFGVSASRGVYHTVVVVAAFGVVVSDLVVAIVVECLCLILLSKE